MRKIQTKVLELYMIQFLLNSKRRQTKVTGYLGLFFAMLGIISFESSADTPNAIHAHKRPSSEAIFAFWGSCFEAAKKKQNIKDNAEKEAVLLKLYCSCAADAFFEQRIGSSTLKTCSDYAQSNYPKIALSTSPSQVSMVTNHFNKAHLSSIQISLIFNQCYDLKEKVNNEYFCSCFADYVVDILEKDFSKIGKPLGKEVSEIAQQCSKWKPGKPYRKTKI